MNSWPTFSSSVIRDRVEVTQPFSPAGAAEAPAADGAAGAAAARPGPAPAARTAAPATAAARLRRDRVDLDISGPPEQMSTINVKLAHRGTYLHESPPASGTLGLEWQMQGRCTHSATVEGTRQAHGSRDPLA